MKIKQSPLNWTHRAREMAVLRRFGQNMNWRLFSIPNVLTAEMRITFLSSPWNSSTVPTVTFFIFKLCSSFLMSFTCAKYGEMIPISSGATFLCVNFGKKFFIYKNKMMNTLWRFPNVNIKRVQILLETYNFSFLLIGPWFSAFDPLISSLDVAKEYSEWIVICCINACRKDCA